MKRTLVLKENKDVGMLRRPTDAEFRNALRKQRKVAPKTTAALLHAGFDYRLEACGASWCLEDFISGDQIVVCGSDDDGGDVRDGSYLFLMYYVDEKPIRWHRVKSLRELLATIDAWKNVRPRAREFNNGRDGEVLITA